MPPEGGTTNWGQSPDFGPWTLHFGLRPRHARGFTLLELLLATVVIALLMLGIHSVFYSAMQLRRRTTDTVEQGLPIQRALAVVKRDLACLVPPGGTLSGTFQSAPTNDTGLAAASLLGRRISPDLYTASGMIDSTSPWSELQKVSYSLAPSTNGGFGLDLVRSVTRNLLSVTTATPEDQVLLGGLEDARFQFYDGTQWLDRWDTSTTSNVMPFAVRVEIAWLDESRTLALRPAPVSLVVPVTALARSNQVAQATEARQ